MKYTPIGVVNRGSFASLLSVCVLLGTVCLSALAQPKGSVAPGDTNIVLPGDTRIISVRYHCADNSSEACDITVTKDEFDALINAFDAKMPQSDRQLLAAEYARVLIMGAHARSRGLEDSAQAQTLLKFAVLQLLSAQLVREMSHEVSPVTAEDENKFYHDHERDYREVVLRRIFIPAQPNHGGEGATQTAARAEAVRSRAVNGEEFARLQREVAGEEASTPPEVPVSCLSIPEALREVCDLRPGEISRALSDGAGYSIYRLESRRSRELSEVRQDIRALLGRLRLQGDLEKIRTPLSLDLDTRYFGALPSSDVAHKHGMHFPPTTSPAAPQISHVHN